MIDDHHDDRDDYTKAEDFNPPEDRDGDEVGYGKPPKKHQFQKGRSGNPKGRTKGARGLKTDLKAELNGRVTVTENGKILRLTKQQVMLKSLVAKAAKGDTRASAQVLAMTMQMFGIEDERTAKSDLSESELAIMESYLSGDLNQTLLLEDASGDADVPPADASGNGNHNNNDGSDVCSPDEESDDESAT